VDQYSSILLCERGRVAPVALTLPFFTKNIWFCVSMKVGQREAHFPIKHPRTFIGNATHSNAHQSLPHNIFLFHDLYISIYKKRISFLSKIDQ
jgi:hypothetical protein